MVEDYENSNKKDNFEDFTDLKDYNEKKSKKDISGFQSFLCTVVIDCKFFVKVYTKSYMTYFKL